MRRVRRACGLRFGNVRERVDPSTTREAILTSFPRRRPSPAMIVALIALVVAMGGTGYAASQLPRNSVGAKQLKKNAVRSSKVKNRSLLASDFKQGQLPARYFASVESQ